MGLEESGHHHTFPKRCRVANGGREEDGGARIGGGGGRHGGCVDEVGGGILPWQQNPASRIYRVSRASGGKDRHSKVYTARGLRDRRVRLSVSTAIQFYDLQDRLGYDQPSKAIEWLIKAAAAAIDELPSLDVFLNPPKPVEEDKEAVEADPCHIKQHQHLSSKSGCSSTSETSKGSVLSLSRPAESYIKTGDGAPRGGAPKEDGDDVVASHQQNLATSLHPHTSFTELLTGGGSGGGSAGGNGATTVAANGSTPNCMQKKIFTTDYFCQAGLLPRSQSKFGSNSALSMAPMNIAASTATAAVRMASHPEMPQLSFLQDRLTPVPAMAMAPPPGDHSLNFPFSSCIADLTRGTLQSNSQSQLPHHHHHSYSYIQNPPSSIVDGSNLPFFGASVASATAITSAESRYPSGFDGRLKLWYANGFRHSDLKGKGES